MRTYLILAGLAWTASLAWAQAPSAAGLPFSPTMPFTTSSSAPQATVRPANGGFSSNYYYGYGQYGYGYSGYGYGYGPRSYYRATGPNQNFYNGNNYEQTYQGYNGKVGARWPSNPAQAQGPPRAFPSAAQESSLHRGW